MSVRSGTEHEDRFRQVYAGNFAALLAYATRRVDAVVADIKRVDVQSWLEALPPEIVTPGRAQAAADKLLAGIPLPPGFDRDRRVRSSHHWTVLEQMADKGFWSEAFWEIADKVAAGQVPSGYTAALGCVP